METSYKFNGEPSPLGHSGKRALAVTLAWGALFYFIHKASTEADDTQAHDACTDLISTAESMHLDETQQQQFCTIELVKLCLDEVPTDLCKNQETTTSSDHPVISAE